MMEKKLYKTKLCILYQRGRCPRESCSFAHGDAELRRFTGSLSGRRDYRSGDLRDKLDRRHSPPRRYSPGRAPRVHHAFRSQKSVSHERGYSLSRSPIKRSERRHTKRQHLNGESDTDSAEDQIKEGKVSSYDEKDVLEEQLKQTQLDIEMLDDQKSQLEIFMEEKVQEEHKISSRIEELETQLNKEQEDCKRITAKIKKFIRAHGRYVKAQEELKRTQARLQRLGDQLGSDTSKPGTNEEDSSVNIVSDGEPNGDNQTSPRNETVNHSSFIKKRQRAYPTTTEEAKLGSLWKRERLSGMKARSGKLIRLEGPVPQSENDSKETEVMKMIMIRKDIQKPSSDVYNHQRRKNSSPSIASLEKVKDSEAGHLLPSTSMAAHAADELIEAIEMEEKSEAVKATAVRENGAADNRAGLPYGLPPPPTFTQNAYKQNEGDDEDVDVDVEESNAAMLDIDLNSEVDIEQV